MTSKTNFKFFVPVRQIRVIFEILLPKNAGICKNKMDMNILMKLGLSLEGMKFQYNILKN